MYNNQSKIIIKKEKNQQKYIKQFNEDLKNNEGLLNDEFFLFQNMDKVKLKLKHIPSKHYENDLFMSEYFKYERDTVNYKYINSSLLNNKIFLSIILKNNPKVYLLLSEDNKKIFKEEVIKNDKDYIIYLTKEDYESDKMFYKISQDIIYMGEVLSCVPKDFFHKLRKIDSYKFKSLVSRLSLKQCKYMKKSLGEFLEEVENEEGNDKLLMLVKLCPYFYSILKNNINSEENKEFIASLALNNHDLFQYFPEKWQKDLNIIKYILSEYKKSSKNENFQLENIQLILNKYPTPKEFIKTYFDTENKITLRNIYPELPLEWRKDESIIKILFIMRDNFKITKSYLKNIPIPELTYKLISQLDSNALNFYNLEEIGDKLEKVINYYYMNEKLEKKAEDKTYKKIKI